VPLVLALAGGTAVRAQDFRVYTRTYDLAATAPQGKAPLLARSTSLFHGGKVYDYLDSDGQMTVFEPAHERFLLVDRSRYLITVLSFEEIESLLFRIGKFTEHKISSLRNEGGKERVTLADHLDFQLKPQFAESFDEASGSLTLASRFVTYQVKSQKREPSEIAVDYLTYADWAARLNHVLHPERPVLPAPRLAVDEALRRRGRFPTEVVLQVHQRNGMHLKAEHRFEWKFDNHDRQSIADAEQMLNDPRMKQVKFEEYQRARLADQERGREKR
jgi:hypothetical protein